MDHDSRKIQVAVRAPQVCTYCSLIRPRSSCLAFAPAGTDAIHARSVDTISYACEYEIALCVYKLLRLLKRYSYEKSFVQKTKKKRTKYIYI